MTKKLLTLMTGGLLLACTAAYAQPTLTSTGCNPTIGESFTMKGGDFETPGAAGPNAVWQITAPNSAPGGVANIVAPSSTAKGSNFPNANIASSNATAGVVTYQKTSGTFLQNHGFVGGSAQTVCVYSNPEDIMHYPFHYQDTYADNWAGQFVSGGSTYYRSGTTTVTADGYGQLTTPSGVYNNVMRVHFIEEYQDSVEISGIPFIISYYLDEYVWYKEGTHVQIGAVYELQSDVSAPISGSIFMLSQTSGLNEVANVISSSSLYPNPAADKLNIDFNLTDNRKVDILIFNELGQNMDFIQTMNGMSGMNKVELNVSALPAGVYFVNIVVEGKIAERKKVVVGK